MVGLASHGFRRRCQPDGLVGFLRPSSLPDSASPTRQGLRSEIFPRPRRERRQSDHPGGEIIEILLGAFHQFTRDEIRRNQVDASRNHDRAEPRENIPQVPVGAEKMMVRGAHRDDSNRLCSQRFKRQMIEEIFQCTADRSSVYRTGDYGCVGTPHALDQPGGVVAVLLRWAAVRESYPLVRKINEVNVDTLMRALRVVEQPPRRVK